MSETPKSAVRMRYFTGKETSDAKPDHMRHIQKARELLASLRAQKQVFEIEQLKRTITLNDGTTITAISSIGFDEIRMSVPVPPPPPPVQEVEPEEEPKEEEDEEKEEEGEDYLWIGIRPVQPIGIEGTPLYYFESVAPLLIEPDGVHQLGGTSGDRLYRRQMLTASRFPLLSEDAFDYGNLYETRSLPNEPVVDYTMFDTDSAFILPAGYEQTSIRYGEDRTDYKGSVMFSANGVVLYDVLSSYYNIPGGSDVEPLPLDIPIPLDPKVPRTNDVYPSGHRAAANNGYLPSNHWHSTFILDPDIKTRDPSHQPYGDVDQQVFKHVKTAIGSLYGNSIKAQNGTYVLKLSAFGFCRHSKPAGPVEVEVEVRLGKPTVKTFNTRIVIDWWSEWSKSMLPFGSRTSSIGGGAPEFGRPNPHGPMWWQGALLINVKNKTVQQVDYHLPEVDIGNGMAMFEQGTWDLTLDVCATPIYYPYMLSSFAPGTVPIGTGLENQAHHFARTFYYATWYAGDQGWVNPASFDWTRYNLAPLISAIVAYATSAGRTDLNGTKIIASGYPADTGTRPNPVITILEMSTTTSDEWTTLVNSGQIYNGTFHHMRAVF